MAGEKVAPTRLWPALVALEGPSGCGKSTLVSLVAAGLQRAGLVALAVSNNDSGRWGPIIRDLAERPERSLTLALATAAARAELREANSSDTLLISDRYVLSSFVYQGFAGVPPDVLWSYNIALLADTTTFLLQLPVAELERRRASRLGVRSNWFKEQLSAAGEQALFDQAAVALAARGHVVIGVDAAPSAEAVAEGLVALIAGGREARP